MENQLQTLTFDIVADSDPNAAYFSFTNSGGLQGWLCDQCQIDPRPGGRLYLWWASGYYVTGVFSNLVPERSVSFTWLGREEPGETQVQVNFSKTDRRTRIELTHFGLGTGDGWSEVAAEYQKGWAKGLENLKSILETGQDLRIVRRPVLGVQAGGVVSGDALREMGFDHPGGIRIEGVVPGTGAGTAGLAGEDVILSLGSWRVPTFPDLSRALDQYYPGDRVEIQLLRGGAELTLEMTLSSRALPDVPGSPANFASSLEEVNAAARQNIRDHLKGLSESEANFIPQSGGWTIKQNLAHLIVVERDNQNWISGEVTDQVSSFNANETGRLDAVIKVHQTIEELLAEWARACAETEAMIRSLPERYVHHRKGSYVKLGYGLLDIQLHIDQHLEQLVGLLAEARE